MIVYVEHSRKWSVNRNDPDGEEVELCSFRFKLWNLHCNRTNRFQASSRSFSCRVKNYPSMYGISMNNYPAFSTRDFATSSNWWQNFDEKFEMCESKWNHSEWPTWQVQKNEKEYEKTKKNTPSSREKTSLHRSIPEMAVRCQPPRKTSQLTAEPEEWPKRRRNSEVCIFCMCHPASPRLADTDAWCFLSLLFCNCGFCRYWVMFDPYLTYFRCYSDNTIYSS